MTADGRPHSPPDHCPQYKENITIVNQIDNKSKETASTFNQTCSAKEQEELWRSRQKYSSSEEDKRK